MTLRQRERLGADCPLCKARLDGGDLDGRVCQGCNVAYHSQCLTELGGCATLGCDQFGTAVASEEPARSAEAVSTTAPSLGVLAAIALPLLGAAEAMAVGVTWRGGIEWQDLLWLQPPIFVVLSMFLGLTYFGLKNPSEWKTPYD